MLFESNGWDINLGQIDIIFFSGMHFQYSGCTAWRLSDTVYENFKSYENSESFAIHLKATKQNTS